MLIVKKLREDAVLPVCAHPGEDLGFDLFSAEEVTLPPGGSAVIDTGIAAQFMAVRQVPGMLVGAPTLERIPYGMLVKDRSSMARKNIVVSGGVIDAGYTGEISVVLTNRSTETYVVENKAKIAQMIPIPVLTIVPVKEVDNLHESTRSGAGFGSTGS